MVLVIIYCDFLPVTPVTLGEGHLPLNQVLGS
jgi:hypothetical protein